MSSRPLRNSLLLTVSLTLAPLPLVGQTAEPETGIVTLSRDILRALERIESKLDNDAQQLEDGWGDIIDGAADFVEVTSFTRHRLHRAELVTAFGEAWEDPHVREAVLLRLASVDLAIDEVASAELAHLQELEQARAKGMRDLIKLLRTIRMSQQELLTYLVDESAAKRLGEINVSLIAAAATEGKRLVDELSGKAKEDEAKLEQKRQQLEKALQTLLEFLKRFA